MARNLGDAVRLALLQLARAGGAGALEELRSAAAAGSFKEVTRALDAAAEAEEDALPSAVMDSLLLVAPRAPAPAAPAAAKPEREAAAAAETAVACAACGAAGAPLMCGACRGVRYCGPECQKRDWRAHKAACKQ